MLSITTRIQVLPSYFAPMNQAQPCFWFKIKKGVAKFKQAIMIPITNRMQTLPNYVTPVSQV